MWFPWGEDAKPFLVIGPSKEQGKTFIARWVGPHGKHSLTDERWDCYHFSVPTKKLHDKESDCLLAMAANLTRKAKALQKKGR